MGAGEGSVGARREPIRAASSRLCGQSSTHVPTSSFATPFKTFTLDFFITSATIWSSSRICWMFHTPPKSRAMVNTRSQAKRDQELYGEMSKGAEGLETAVQEDSRQPNTKSDRNEKKEDPKQVEKPIFLAEQSEKVKRSYNTGLPSKSEKISKSKSRSKSASSSVLARKKRLELEAAEAKAKIQMELIDKRLMAELAELEDEEYSSQSEGREEGDHTKVQVEKWLERSHRELEAEATQPQETNLGDLDLPLPLVQQTAARGGTDGTVHMLASALKDLAAATTANGSHAQMLSRLSTPKDLPGFGGDPMDWLQFKQAYEDSTKVCNFSNQENLWRLRKCLHGAAKNAVTALLISATSPDIVMSTLELQFGNPDIIISKIVYEINKLQPMAQEYHKEIVTFSVKVKNYVAAVLAIGQDEYLKGTNVISIILSKLPAVLISKWADYSYPIISSGDKPKLVILSEFLNQEAIKISKTSVNIIYNPSEYKRKQSDNVNRTHTVLVQNSSDSNIGDDKCRFCKINNHKIIDCKKFKKALRKDRWQFIKRNGLCYKCLVLRHNRDACSAPVCDKDNCGQSHHQLLHFPDGRGNEQSQPSVAATPAASASASVLPSEAVAHINDGSYSQVLLKTVPIKIHGPYGTLNTVALLDDGSTVTIASDELMVKLGIRGRKQTLKVRSAWGGNELMCDSEIVDLSVSNSDGTMFTLQARTTKGLNLPMQFISLDKLKCSDAINNIKHKICFGQCKPEILIGQDNYYLLLPLEVIRGNPTEPYLTRTPLGWCLHGRTTLNRNRQSEHSALLLTEADESQIETKSIMDDLHEEVRRSFSIEAMGISGKPRLNAEDERAIAHLERTSTLKDGHWYIGLPWKDENCKMPESYTTAFNRLKGVERKLKKCVTYAERYKERIYHLLHNDYARELTNVQTTPKTWYLPHFGVDNPNKKKMRLVFDAAAKSHKFSLNDYLLTGPDLLVSLYGIMLRFRESRVAVTGDIRDMFLRIKIQSEDQNALRFLWRDSPDDPVRTYAMTSLIFGSNSSPFISQFIKNKNAKRFETTYPAAVNAICNQHYIDDYIDSLEDESTALRLTKEIAHIHKCGGFEIRNWNSNSAAVLENLPKETLCSTAVRFKVGQQETGERTLGLIWYPKEDTLGFDTSFKRIPENIIKGLKRPTKREMLRLIMSIFDVYGFLSPFTIKAKILLQQMWKINLCWDDEIPDSINDKWLNWLKLLKNVGRIRLPRCYHASVHKSETVIVAPNVPDSGSPTHAQRQHIISNESHALTSATRLSYTNLQLHIFSDSSTYAMAAVAFWRWQDNDAQTKLAFISSKCRVAPLKHTSVPRLELQAALLAARLADTITKEHRNMLPQERYFWCDSSTVLHWIRNNARDYKAFVAHRLGEIDELTQMKEWHFIPTKMNIADIATRDSCELDMLQNEWLYGPEFLYKEKETWPADVQPEVSTDVLERVSLVVTEKYSPAVPEPERFSSWLRLLKSTCMVLLFIDKCKKLTSAIDGDMMRRAERLLIMHSQSQTFAEDLENLKQKKPLDRKSKLLTLTPVIDEYGVLRVGSRIDQAPGIPTETKYPVILDGRNYVAQLIVKHHHVKAAHGNQEVLVNNLKQHYWIIRLRPTIKHVTSKCMFCRIRKAQPQPPRMGNLPEARMAYNQRPFTFCGVDLFGPMEVTVQYRRREKRYGVLFTCLTVRAIHIEVVSKLTSDAFIMALRRMAARRGWPQHMYSDNGTNLRGGLNEIRKSISELDEETLKGEAANYGTTWTFTPPASPHWGGAWERLIRCVKNSLKVVLKERAPRDEVLNTLLAEVEHMVNSRPLTHVSVEPHSDESLTPNHFLLGSSSNLPTIGKYDESDTYLRKQWRISQRLADLFWKRWVREVLPDMRPRTKWHQEQTPLKVGDLVLIVDPDSPRNVWPRGRVQTVMAGRDGRIRVLDIKTKTGMLRRSAARLARIPTEDEC